MTTNPSKAVSAVLAAVLTAASAAVALTALSVTVNAPSAAAAVTPSDFQQVTLAKGVASVGEPMSLAVLPDRSVVHTARDGTVRVTDPAGATKVAGKLSVYSHDEEGLQGVGVDPGFANDRWVYLYYAPPLSTPGGDAPDSGTAADFAPFNGYNQLSRFQLRTDNTLDLGSEQQILRINTSRGICCHVGGDIDFDAQGNLYMTTGDDTNPFASDGYSPLDESPNRNPAYDAQRSAGNTNDLRGKLLRIHVESNGSYTIPAGNLFAPGTANTRPEIYAMGFRNPFRMSVDKATGTVYIGDYGPDASAGSSSRGPGGQVEFDRVTGPGNFGWPYCTGTNTSYEEYNHYDFATSTSGAKYDCAAGPMNTSRNNTGLQQLPPAQPAWIKYGDQDSRPEMGPGGSESPMGGPVYHYDPANPSTTKFPQSLDGHVFIGEFGRGWIKEVTLGGDGSAGAIGDFPFAGKQVMDTAFGPDGSLYVLDYGTGYFNGDANSALYRIDYVGANGNRAPQVSAAVDKTSGIAPLVAHFTSTASDPEGDPLTYSWNFGDGATAGGSAATHTYTTNGQFSATVTVSDGHGNTAVSTVIVTVGNTAPTVVLELPDDGQQFSFGDAVPWRVSAWDPEDGPIDCSKVTLNYVLGHDNHGHPQTSQTGCSGTIQTVVDSEHDADANLFGVFDAQYTDAGGLTTHAQHIVQPKTRQAEYAKTSSGVQVVSHTNAHGAHTIGYVDPGDWIEFDPYDLANVTGFSARVASGGAGGTIELRAGSPSGTLLGTLTVTPTGGWETFTDVSTTLSNQPITPTSLYLVFQGSGTGLFDVDQFTVTTTGNPPAATAIQAEQASAQSGTQVVSHNGAENGHTLGYIDNGDSATYPVDVSGAVAATIRASSNGIGGSVEVHAGSATGPLLGTVNVPNTGDWETFTSITTGLSAGTGNLVLVFKGGTGALFDLDALTLWKSSGSSGGPGPITGIGGKCVDVSGANTADGTKIQLWTCNGTGAQSWTITGQVFKALGKCLDVSGAGTANGTNVQLWTCNGTAAQNWVAQGDGSLRNPNSNRCLDASGGSTADGTQLQIWDCTGGTNQKWTLP